MVVFSIKIENAALLRGIAAAREQFNKDSHEMIARGSDASCTPIFEQDEEYVGFLVKRAAEHFARKYLTDESVQQARRSRLSKALSRRSPHKYLK